MNFEDIEAEFNNIQDMENDPFFSFREEKYSIGLVAKNYIQASRFWLDELRNNWDMTVLNSENFDQRFLKKEVSIEDLVRLLNTGGSFYRNRDLYLIFERLKR